MVRLRLLGVILGTVLVGSLAVGCGDDVVTGTRNIAPAPRPAPTIEGRVVDDFAPGVDDRVAIVGVPAGETVGLRALPGVNQPMAGAVPANADGLYGFGQSFETEDGRRWWLVRWQDEQGWIEPGAAYLGTAVDVTGMGGVASGATFATTDELVGALTAGESGEVVVVERLATMTTVDVLVADELRVGRRLLVEAADTADGVTLVSVQQIPLCRRGLTDTGDCA